MLEARCVFNSLLLLYSCAPAAKDLLRLHGCTCLCYLLALRIWQEPSELMLIFNLCVHSFLSYFMTPSNARNMNLTKLLTLICIIVFYRTRPSSLFIWNHRRQSALPGKCFHRRRHQKERSRLSIQLRSQKDKVRSKQYVLRSRQIWYH